MPTEIDRARTVTLAAELLRAIRPTLAAQPPGHDNVLVVLNATAAALCPVLAGTGFDPAALAFFRRALAENLLTFALDHGLDCAIPDWLAEGIVAGEGAG